MPLTVPAEIHTTCGQSELSIVPLQLHMLTGLLLVQMQDEFLKRLAEDTVLYVRTVCNTIIMEVPKAIVHCQV